jgi:hypothetical protein
VTWAADQALPRGVRQRFSLSRSARVQRDNPGSSSRQAVTRRPMASADFWARAFRATIERAWPGSQPQPCENLR